MNELDLKSEADFKDLVLRNFKKLPGQQQQVAEYLLSHPEEFPFLSVPGLAKGCSVSEATIVRFAQRIGFDGFSSMKAALSNMIRGKVASQAGEEDDFLTLNESTLNVVARQEIANIRNIAEDLDRGSFEASARALFEADHIYTFGLGISSHLAELTSYLFSQVGLRTTVLSTRFSSPLEQVVALREGDLLFVFSYPPFSKQTISLVEMARDRGVKTLAITDRLTAPVSKHADFLFRVRSNNKMFTNSIGAVSVFLNALTTEIAMKHGKHATDAVARINEILAEDSNLITNEGKDK